MKVTSVGAFITDGRSYLACHSTGNSFYDLPKGLKEADELPIDACCRETREETGITLNPNQLTDLGVFPYLKNKDLHLFSWVPDQLPDPDDLVCSSFFEHPKSKRITPEVDGYRYVQFHETDALMAKNMARIIHQLVDKQMFRR
ncbi:NUDIX domain-containing protein [Paenibacillus xerothermodurans]|uniref:NUDIX hydrolase n=1 Tax=Paenibacillus xerothermodurans TaxID=1977292 RepID=A0A2W1NQC7_PAEXE|nr:NUDIX hydrolase [Paenibacillus xerothermodurans]PZE21685.1 NUDIX hydrolase [Paenibacillus xerothermodurans]